MIAILWSARQTEALFFGLFALMIMLFSIFFLREWVWFYRRAIEIKNAEVIEIVRKKAIKSSYQYFPVFSFVDITGVRQVVESKVSANPAPFKVGDKVTIYLSQSNSSDVRFKPGYHKIFIFFGCILALISLIFFILSVNSL